MQTDNELKVLRAKLAGALIGVVRGVEGNIPEAKTDEAIIHGLQIYARTGEAAHAQLNADIEGVFPVESGKDSNAREAIVIEAEIDKLHEEKFRLVPDCATCASPCGRTFDYDMSSDSDPETIATKAEILRRTAKLAAEGVEPGSEEMNLIYMSLYSIGYYDRAEDLAMCLEKLF